MIKYLKQAGNWIGLLLLTDVGFIFVVWIMRREAMKYMVPFIILFTALVASVGIFMDIHRRQKTERIIMQLLEAPTERVRDELVSRLGNREIIDAVYKKLVEQSAMVNERTVELMSYREYIESWVHEAKTPLALSTLVLDNHRDEMSPYVYARMNYISHQLGEDVERILFYARLQTDHTDIKYTKFLLDECILEVLHEYKPFFEEKKIKVRTDISLIEVVSDRKIVFFMLSQLIDNAVKYADEKEGELFISLNNVEDKVHLGIYNNGEGVLSEDAPFIFDKGFTGGHPNRQKATGMGLYLVKKYAEKICVALGSDNYIPYETGFGIELIFTL
ncbi:MAG: HAMP domain-containing histidine kinase [Clostridium sp.]|nr:HAMP domain-containing histidine kinase [Clostridium sp.]MCM1399773.1 HAMP domain-containing histidine kinase [Clostridium sp.]MCM1459600.1 HAMP domain-containing histidine kinase [Bacteroides sp.]